MLVIPILNFRYKIYKSALVLLAIFCSIMIMPFFEGSNAERIFVSLLLTCICVLEIYSDTKILSFYRIQLFLGSSAVVIAWLTRVDFFPKTLLFIEYLFFTLFFLISTLSTIYKVSHCMKLNNDTIFNAINGYLFLGLFGASMASVLGILEKNAFNFSSGNTSFHEFEKFIYYSFVTLTTVGYGDITPVTNGAKVLTIFLCISGQLYLTVLIGLIIGKYVAKMSISMKQQANH